MQTRTHSRANDRRFINEKKVGAFFATRHFSTVDVIMELYNFTSQCLGHDALVGVVTSETSRSTLNLRQTIAERGLLPDSSRQTRGRCLDGFFKCEMPWRRGPFECIYLFGFEKTAAREKRRRWQTKLHAKWRRHLFSQLRKKKFLFVIFTTMHSTSQFLLALRDDSLREKIRRRAEQRRLTIVKCFFSSMNFHLFFSLSRRSTLPIKAWKDLLSDLAKNQLNTSRRLRRMRRKTSFGECL